MSDAMPRSLPALPYPSSPDSEKGLIGSLLLAPQKVLETIAQKRFQPEWIYSEVYKNLLLLAQEMVKEGQPVDLITISQKAKDRWPESEADYAATATECYTFVPTAGNASFYMEMIQEKAAKRLAMQECERMYQEFGNGSSLQDVHDLVTGGFAKVKEACAKPEAGNVDLENLNAFMDQMQDVIDGKAKVDLLETSLPTITEELGGYSRGEVIVIQGLPGTGKSLSAQAIIQPNVFDKNKSAMIFTMEMPTNQYLRRLHASLGPVSIRSMRNGQYTQKELAAFSRAFGEVAKATQERRLCIRDLKSNTMTPQHIESAIRRRHKDHGLDIVCIDHLHLVKFLKKKSESRRDQDLQEFTASMKRLAIELNVLMIILAQANQQGLVFDSSLTEADCDFMFAMLPEYASISGVKKIVGTNGIYVQKAREGRRGYKIPMTMKGEFCQIYEAV